MKDTARDLRAERDIDNRELVSSLHTISEMIRCDGSGRPMSEAGKTPGRKRAAELEAANRLGCLEILKALRFPEMHDRYEALAIAHVKTFEWIFREDACRIWWSYREWLLRGQGVYWIQGKAASGKSTLMRFISEDCRTIEYLRDWAGDSPLELVRFYFWKSGALEQRSLMGLLRSLMYEILIKDKYTQLARQMFPDELERVLLYPGAKLDQPNWRLSTLKKAFASLLQQSESRVRICFFIDGIDEYDGNHEEIALFFNELSSQYHHIKFCISSRP
jgi:hypothetical protein